MASWGSVTTTSITNLYRTAPGAFKQMQKPTGKETPSELKQIEKSNQEIKLQRRILAGQAAQTVVNAASASYSTATAVSRFGLRGQDIKDQKTIQDKLVGQGLSITSSFIGGAAIGGLQAGAVQALLTTVGIGINELVNASLQQQKYEYNRAYDLDVSGLGRERQGAMAYNYSRRGAF